MTSTITLRLKPDKKVFFASDFHLGAPDYAQSRTRERKIVDWLNQISPEAAAIFLVGDVFDFWFEYQAAVPKGFVRLLGKIAELTDQNIPVFIFSGNHDMWMFDYLPKELGVQVFHKPQVFDIQGFRFLIGHGDGLGPGDHFYKFLKLIFRNRLCQWLFARLHPNFGIGLASFLSRRSRAKNLQKHPEEKFLGKENEWLYLYCQSVEEKEHFDYYVFGHRHLPLNVEVGTKSRYINLGEWLRAETYAVFDGKDVELLKYKSNL